MNKNNSSRTTFFLLIGILAVSFVLRIWSVNFGLPDLFHCDERIFPYNAFYAISHKGKIFYVHNYGSFIPYLLSGLYAIYFLILKIIGAVVTPFDFLVLFMKNPSNIYLIGRTLFVIAGTMSVFILYLLGKKLYNKSIGLLSAGFLGISFLAVQQSKFMKGDTLGTLFLLLAFYFMVSSKCNDKTQKTKIKSHIYGYRQEVLAGVFMGLTVAARFTLWIVPFCLVFMCLINKKAEIKQRLKNCLVLAGSGIIAFLITTPIIIFQFHDFVNEMHLRMAEASTAWISPGAQPIWLFYLTEHMGKGIGWPLEIISICGVFYSMYKRENIGLVVFLVLFFALVLNNSANFERYAVPVIPFFALFAGRLVYRIAFRVHPQIAGKGIALLIIIIAVIPNLVKTFRYNYLISCPDTRTIARKFIESTVPAGAKIVAEGAETYEQTSGLGIKLHKSKEQLEKQLKIAQSEGVSGNYLQAMIAGQSAPGYNIENICLLEKPPYKESDYDGTVNIYVENQVEYLVTLNWRTTWGCDSVPERFLNSMEREYELVKEFKPCPVFKWDYYCFRIDYNALSKVSGSACRKAGFNGIIGGPVISIYKKKIVNDE